MSYCTIEQVDALLAQALTSATDYTSSNNKIDMWKLGNARDKNSVSDTVVNQYIHFAAEAINASLNQLYVTPFKEKADYDASLYSNIDSTNKNIVLKDNFNLDIYDKVVLISGSNKEEHYIEKRIGVGVYSTKDAISFNFPAGSRIIRVKYPDPISYLCSIHTASSLYDKYYAAQSESGPSEYGKKLMEVFDTRIRDILLGHTILHQVERIGRRLYDPNLVDQYSIPDPGTVK